MTLVFLFTFAIGNVWGATETITVISNGTTTGSGIMKNMANSQAGATLTGCTVSITWANNSSSVSSKYYADVKDNSSAVDAKCLRVSVNSGYKINSIKYYLSNEQSSNTDTDYGILAWDNDLTPALTNPSYAATGAVFSTKKGTFVPQTESFTSLTDVQINDVRIYRKISGVTYEEESGLAFGTKGKNLLVQKVDVTVEQITEPGGDLDDPTIIFSNSNYTIDGADLDLSSLFTSNSKGAVTYSIKNANGTGAALRADGKSFYATTVGTATVTASQAEETGKYKAGSADATITVSPAGAVESNIIYTETKGATNTNPAKYIEGTGIASFAALADVTDFHFTGWSPASIADDATGEQTIEAQWVAAYNVTFDKNGATGTAPDAFQKWNGATFNLPDQGSMVAPSGKAFDGWKANGTGDKLAAGAEYTMGAAAVQFVAQWKPVIKLVKDDGSLNTTDFSAIDASLVTEDVTVEGKNYSKTVKVGGAASGIPNVDAFKKVISYETTTDATHVKISLYDVYSSSTTHKAYVMIVKEGEVTPIVNETISITISTKRDCVKEYDLTGHSNLYICVEKQDIRVCQIEVNENGTALEKKEAPAVGYSINLNKGRLLAPVKQTNTAYEGLTYNLAEKYLPGSSADARIKNLNSEFISFVVPTGQTRQLQLTTSNTNNYTVSKTKGDDQNQFTPTANTAKSWNLTAGTWYINPQGSNVQITNIAFATAPAAHTISFDSDGGSDVASIPVFDGDKATAPADPTKEHAAFVKWVVKSSGADFDWTANVTDDVTLKAIWTQLYTISFANGGGSGDAPAAVADKAQGETFTVPANTYDAPTGKVFAGWNDGSADYAEGDTYTVGTDNVVLTAQWINANFVARIGSTYYTTLADALLHAADGEIVLLQDIDVTAQVEIAAGVTATIDLAGHKIEYTGSTTLSSGVILVHNGGSLTINDSSNPDAGSIVSGTKAYAAVALTKLGDDASTPATLVVNGGALTGYYYGITGNGSRNNTVITIHGGTITGTVGTAIYNPQVGTLTVNNGTLTGLDAAIEMRAGTLAIIDGTFTATATEFSCISNGSGSTTTGAAIAIAQHSTQQNISVTINGGTFNGVKAISEANPQNNPAPAVTMAVTAGTFTGEVTTVDVDKFISGGTFSVPVAEANCATGYVPETKANGKYGVIVPAQSIDFEAIIDAKGTDATAIAELDAQLAAKHYDIDGTLNNDRLEAGGFKVKKTGLTISFSVEKAKVVEITTGHISGASIKVDGADAVAMEGNKKHTYYSDDAQAFLITMTAAGNAYNIFKSINIRDPFTVTFKAYGDADPAALQGKPSVILPSATNGTKSLTGWFTEETGGTKIGDATDEYTPTANITLHAQWEDISTDARLASITLDPSTGVLSPSFDPEVTSYTYTMPYGTAAIPQITSATAVNAGGSYSIVSQASAWDETAVIRGVAASSDTKAYNITMKLAPKDGICLIKGIVGNNTFVIDEDASLLSGTTEKRDVRSESSTYEALTGWKFQSKGAYLGITLDGDNTFQENDVVEVYVTTLAGDGTNKKVYVYTDKTTDNLSSVLLASSEADQKLGKNQVVLPATTTNKLYLCRGDDKKDYVNWNPYVAYFAVYRPLPPVLKKVTVNGVEGKPNALNEIVIEVAASTTQSELEAIAYEWVSNSDAWTANPANAPVAANAWEFGVANTVTLTDKDGDVSVYTVTVNKAIPSSNVELATLTVDGNAITLVPGQAVYSYEYPYGTAVTPAPVVAATAEDANAEVGTITQAASKNGTATFTVTAEDGTTYRDYTIKISVSRVPAVVIYDGSTMDAIAENGSVNGLTWSITDANTLNATSAAGTFEGKNYAKEVNLFTSATKGEGEGDTRYVTITIPEDYVAKFRLVGASNSSGSDASANRSIFISKTKTGTLDKSIAYATSMNYNTLAGMTSDYQLPGVYYLCADKSIRLYELSVQLYPIDYSRATTEGRYGTICLPNGGVMVGATLYEVAYYGQTSKKIFFDEILNGTMEAGVPYIFLPKEGASQLAVYYTDEANESAKNANGLHGFIGANADAEMNVPVGAYILNANQYREVVTLGTAKIKSNRSYIVLEDINPSEPALAPGRRRISMSVYSEQVATGIENTGFESEAPRKVLINGELYIIRGEKMYDAKGQLVK